MDRKILPNILKTGFKKAMFLVNFILKHFKRGVLFVKHQLSLIHRFLLQFEYYKKVASLVKKFTSWKGFKKPILFIKKHKRYTYAFSLIVLVLLGFQLYRAGRASAWWNNDWHYRKPITINYTGTTELSDFQIRVHGTALDETTLNSNGKLQGDCSDIRFTDNNGKKLDYWIEETSGTNDLLDCSATDYDIWVKIPKIQTGDNIIYFYYGNEQAQSESNGENTFEFFDDFTNALNTSVWSTTGAYTLSGGELNVTTGAVYSSETVDSNPQNRTIEMKASWAGDDDQNLSGIEISDVQNPAGSNSNSDALAYNMSYVSGYNLYIWGADGTDASYNIIGGTNFYSQTTGTEYIVGYDFVGTSSLNYFVKDTSYTSLATNNPTGTWSDAFYLILGYYQGSSASTTDVDDISVDWVRVRKYASTSPGTPTAGSEQTQEDYSSSGGEPVAFWPLTSDTCDNTGCINMKNAVDSGDVPVLQMDFEEGRISDNQCVDGGVADICDGSGQGNNGTTGGTMTDSDYVTGKTGNYALDLDGTDDYVVISDNSSLRNSNKLTLSAWVYPETIDDYDVIASYGENGDGNLRFHWGTGTSDHFRFDWSSDGTNYSQNEGSTVLSLNTWSFISTTFDNGTVRMFVNGELVDEIISSTDTLYESPGNLYIGRRDDYASSRLFDGYIDNFRLYNYARTPEQIKQDYNNTKAYFGHGSKSPSFESVSSTAPGDPHVNSTRQYLNFDGVNDYIGPINHSLINASAGSISLWASVKGSQSNPAYLFSLPDGVNDNRIYIGYANGGYEVSCRLATGTTIGSYTMEDSVLYELVCTWDGTSAHFYVNGEDETTTSTFDGFTTTTVDFYLGSLSGSTQYIKGQIAGVKIFDYALDSDEVKTLYNAGIDGSGTGKAVKIGR